MTTKPHKNMHQRIAELEESEERLKMLEMRIESIARMQDYVINQLLNKPETLNIIENYDVVAVDK